MGNYWTNPFILRIVASVTLLVRINTVQKEKSIASFLFL